MNDPAPIEERGDGPPPSRPPTPWIVAAVVVTLLVAVIGWRLRAAGSEAALQRALAEAHRALDRGETGTAARALEGQVDEALLDRPDVAWAAARLAASNGDDPRAGALFDRASGDRSDFLCAERAALAVHHGSWLLQTGKADHAEARIEETLGRCAGEVDDYLDRGDLDDVARAPEGSDVAPAVAPLLQLLDLRVRVAVRRAEALDAAGEAEAAGKALDQAETRVAATCCSGTHRVYCRGPRAGLRDRLLAPLDAARTRRRAAAALALVREGKVDDALDEARAAVQAAEKARDEASAGDKARATAAWRSAATVAYSVEIAAAQDAERRRAWTDAVERYAVAGRLWDALAAAPHGDEAVLGAATGEIGRAPAPMPGAASPTSAVPAHVSGLRRAETLAKLLAATDTTADKLGALGLDAMGVGDADRRRLHDRLAQTPLDARVYVEEALARIRRSRAADRSPADRRADAAAARELLDAALAVLPDNQMVRFYRGVRDVLEGRGAAGLEAMEQAYRAGYHDRAAALHLGEAYAALGKTRLAADRWKDAWRADKDDAATARRAVEALVQLGAKEEAAALVAELRTAHGADAEVLVAEALVALAVGDASAYAQARLGLDARTTATLPAEVQRGRRVATAATTKARAALDGALRPGEVVLEAVFGHAVAADSEGRLLGEKVQCAVVVITDQRVLLLRWDARHDRRAQVGQGVDIVRRSVRLGGRVGRELARLQLEGLRDLVAVLEWLPEGAKDKRPSLVEEGAELAVATLALIDAVGADVALSGDLAGARVTPLDGAVLDAWSLVALHEAPGLWLWRGKRKGGGSPFGTDGDSLVLHHDRPELLTALLRLHLGPPADAP
ncbi:MAG: hypothetical protein H6747_09925 [Deltaproteobacteria bacterium]|nr:hypothetical protein [Deltaproteobacteria bacterium]